MSLTTKLHLPLAVAASLAASLRFSQFTAEDAFLVARYAENLVDHGELTFNPGERVCALTSPLHALVEATLYAAFGRTLVAYKLLSVLLLYVTLRSMLALVGPDRGLRALATVLLLLNPAVLVWTAGGLETPILLLLATALAASCDPSRPLTAASLTRVWVLAGLAFVTRYDSVLFSAPLALEATWRARGVPKALPLMLGAAAPLAWLSFASAYYEDVLPTSFFVKGPVLDAGHLESGLVYVFQQLTLFGVLPLAGFVWATLVLSGRSGEVTARLRQRRGMWLGLLGAVIYALTSATAHMMFCFRIFVPFLPAAIVVALDLVSLKGRRGARSDAALLLGIVLLLGLQSVFVWRVSVDGMSSVGEYKRLGLRDYSRLFLTALEANASDVRDHWDGLGVGRAPRLTTFAVGRMPYALKEAYVYERLVSFRHRCTYDYRRSSDYVHVLVPRHGPLERQLGADPSRFERVSSHPIMFDGELETFAVFYQPNATPNRLPRTVVESCLGP